MTDRPKFVKRIRRRAFGGKVEFRFYDDGAIRVRVDHPSNDPGIEIAIAGLVLHGVRGAYAELEGGELRLTGPVQWKDDPPTPSSEKGAA